MLNKILEKYPEEEILLADGFDEAIIGFDPKSGRVIYSIVLILDILTQDMPIEEAIEYFEFNVQGAWVGEKTPIYCDDYFE